MRGVVAERGSLQPTSRLLVLTAGATFFAALPALAPGSAPSWLIAIAVLALAVALDGAWLPPAHTLAVAVDAPARVAVGVERGMRLRAVLPLERPVAAEATLDLRAPLEPTTVVPLALSHRPVAVDLPLLARRRGRGAVEALWLRYAGPLGLLRRTVRCPLDLEIDAVPDLALVKSSALAAVSSRSAPSGIKVERFAGDGSEFHALREFSEGLDRRAIDWKASARHTRLLAREVRAERNHRVVLAIDTGRLMAEPVAGVPLLDHAIHAALALAWVGLAHGDRVGLYAFDQGGHTHSPPRAGAASLPALIELTAGLDYRPVETNFTLALTELASRLRRRTLVVVLTDFVDAVSAELMVENLLRLGRRHLVLFVALRDPELDRTVLAAPRQLEDLERATVADLLLHERETVLRRLRRAGIQVVDASPGAVGSRLINRYLEIMRREMI